MGKVSVILPNYNHAAYLKERLDSVFNQTYKNFEIIILDDASTDNSLDVLNKYKENKKVSHYIVNTQNSGSPFKQWQKGLDLAKGEYVWIAESDDFAEDNFLEETVKVISLNEDLVFVYTDSKIITNNEAIDNHWKDYKNKFFKTTRWNSNYKTEGKTEVIDYLFYKTTVNNVSAVLFKKSVFDNKAFINELIIYKNAGDLFTYMYTALLGKIGYISAALNNYREHDLNITKQNIKSGVIFIERLNCFGKVLDILFNDKISDSEKRKLKRACRYIIKKNAFSLLDFGYVRELDLFMKKLYSYKIFNLLELNYYAVLFKMYISKNTKIKALSKRGIKRMSKV